MESSKMIVIKSKGRIETSRGRVYAPIKTPYRESISMILKMLTVYNADVWEILPTKEEIKLTTTNYDKNNNPRLYPPVDPAPPSAIESEAPNTLVGNLEEVTDPIEEKEFVPNVPDIPVGVMESVTVTKGEEEEWIELDPEEESKEVSVEFSANPMTDNPVVNEAAEKLMDQYNQFMQDMNSSEKTSHVINDLVGNDSEPTPGNNWDKKSGKKNRHKNRNNKPVEATIPEEVE